MSDHHHDPLEQMRALSQRRDAERQEQQDHAGAVRPVRRRRGAVVGGLAVLAVVGLGTAAAVPAFAGGDGGSPAPSASKSTTPGDTGDQGPAQQGDGGQQSDGGQQGEPGQGPGGGPAAGGPACAQPGEDAPKPPEPGEDAPKPPAPGQQGEDAPKPPAPPKAPEKGEKKAPEPKQDEDAPKPPTPPTDGSDGTATPPTPGS